MSDGNWARTALGACASLVGDKMDPADCGDMPYIGLEHVGQGTLSLRGSGTAKDVESTKAKFRAGDILFGKLRPYFRKVVRPSFDGICSTDIWVVRPQAGVDAGYLFYLMASEALVDFASQGSEGTRMPRAKWEHVAKFPLRLPPISEQNAVANILSALDDKIELNRRMVETLEETVRILFKSWFVDSDVPSGGGLKPVGQLCAIFGGSTPSTKISEYWHGGFHCWATPRDLAGLQTSVLIGTARRIKMQDSIRYLLAYFPKVLF